MRVRYYDRPIRPVFFSDTNSTGDLFFCFFMVDSYVYLQPSIIFTYKHIFFTSLQVNYIIVFKTFIFCYIVCVDILTYVAIGAVGNVFYKVCLKSDADSNVMLHNLHLKLVWSWIFFFLFFG